MSDWLKDYRDEARDDAEAEDFLKLAREDRLCDHAPPVGTALPANTGRGSLFNAEHRAAVHALYPREKRTVRAEPRSAA